MSTAGRQSNYITSAISRAHQLNKFRLTGKLTDFVFKIEDKKFPVHAVILAVHSLVFSELFDSPTNKSESESVLLDVDPEDFEEFLSYLYTGEDPLDLDRRGLGLMSLSHKYGVTELFDKCASYLSRTLNCKTFADRLAASLLYNNPLLKAKCAKYIQYNFLYVISSPSWVKISNDFSLTTFITNCTTNLYSGGPSRLISPCLGVDGNETKKVKLIGFLHPDKFCNHTWQIKPSYFVMTGDDINYVFSVHCEVLYTPNGKYSYNGYIKCLNMGCNQVFSSQFSVVSYKYSETKDIELKSNSAVKCFIFHRDSLSLVNVTLTFSNSQVKKVICDFRPITSCSLEVTDVVIIVKECKFLCNKNLLARHSSYFRGIFSVTDLSEYSLNDVDTTDFESVSNYLGTRRFPDPDKISLSLAQTSFVLGLPELMIYTCKVLSEKINLGNAIDLLLLGHHAADEGLIELTQIFIAFNFKTFLQSEGWQKIKDYPEIMKQLLMNVYKMMYEL